MQISIKRISDPRADGGFRVLVDRHWPRGVKKDDVRIELWAKELAPTAGLRRWFNHDVTTFGEFRSRYLKELESKSEGGPTCSGCRGNAQKSRMESDGG